MPFNVMLVIWVYYSPQILFFGAELTQVYARHCHPQIEPTRNAEFFTETPASAGTRPS